MRKFLLVITILSFAFNSRAQTKYVQYELLRAQDLSGSPVSVDHQYDGIIGEAFYSSAWLGGSAYTRSGKKFAPLKLKFDINANKVYLNRNDTVYDISGGNVIRFDLYPSEGDTSVVYTFSKEITSPYFSINKYVQVFSQGKLTFVKYLAKSVQEVYENSPLEKQKKLIDDNHYYIISEKNESSEIKLNKKSLEKISGDKWNEVNKYANDNKLSFSTESGWAKIISYYNSL